MKKRAYGTGRIYKPKGCNLWYVQYWRDGKQIRESSHSTTKQVAEQLLRERLHGKDTGKISIVSLKQTPYGKLRAMLLDHYREQNHKSLQELDSGDTIWGLPQLDKFFDYDPRDENSGTPLEQITSETVNRFIKGRLAEPKFVEKREAGDKTAGHGTVNRSLALLRTMLNLFAERNPGYIVPRIKQLANPPARKGFVDREQFLRLVSNLPDHLKPLITFLYWTGCRKNEAAQITWDQVDPDAALVRLEADQTKNSEARTIPLANEVVKMLATIKDNKSGAVFSTVNLRHAWAIACAKAGLDVVIHDLRRSAIRNLMNVGVSENVAMKISGHKTNSVFKRYHIVNTDDTVAAMRKLETKVNGHSLPAKKQTRALPAAN